LSPRIVAIVAIEKLGKERLKVDLLALPVME
jgi:hypothetical protein